jgi:hypothetical protein
VRVCVARLIERAINMEVWRSRHTFESETRENLVSQLNAVASWVTQYQQVRRMYTLGSRDAQQGADIIVDGMKAVTEITTSWSWRTCGDMAGRLGSSLFH